MLRHTHIDFIFFLFPFFFAPRFFLVFFYISFISTQQKKFLYTSVAFSTSAQVCVCVCWEKLCSHVCVCECTRAGAVSSVFF